MGFHSKLLLFLLLLVVCFITTHSIPINAEDVVEKHIITMKEVARSRNHDELKTLISESVFELEDAKKVHRALRTARLKVVRAKFKSGGIKALILDRGLFYSWLTMRRDEESSTGWKITKAGFLECMVDLDTDSFCIEE
ncbi:hypothetical protein CAEBREN_21152 [Caenorhabditis brenneri]|uniref:Uncharacterized protein n=1 Tax=Caenorhabditis brenneri TaxID=135651 RepID=G0MQI1_CAEBE|nr:hypothetical protein CAEBREN_21152 [Caenorhabditis brenneri]